MDDLKVILYVVVALIWVVYNNYKKISDASKKRDLSKPAQEVSQEPRPQDLPKPSPVTYPKREIIEKQSRKVLREIYKKKSSPVPAHVPKKPVAIPTPFISESFLSEGGSIKPSGIVNFEETAGTNITRNPILERLRSMDLRTGIIMAEVLKRPYY